MPHIRLFLFSLVALVSTITTQAWILDVPNVRYDTIEINFATYDSPTNTTGLTGVCTIDDFEYNDIIDIIKFNDEVSLVKNMSIVGGSTQKCSGLLLGRYKQGSAKAIGHDNYHITASKFIHSIELTYSYFDNTNKEIDLKQEEPCYADNTKQYSANGTDVYTTKWEPIFPSKNSRISATRTTFAANPTNDFCLTNNISIMSSVLIYKMTFILASTSERDIIQAFRSYKRRDLLADEQRLAAAYNGGDADVNKDGVINSSDVVGVYNNILNGGINTTHDTYENDFVDLGLPSGTLWAATNLGATLPESAGNYYGFLEEPGNSFYHNKSIFTAGNYRRWYTEEPEPGKNLDKSAAQWEHDDSWHVPTLEQWQELLNPAYTKEEITHLHGRLGIRITSIKNHNSIFLPAAGCVKENGVEQKHSYGWYWVGTRAKTESIYENAVYFSPTSKLNSALVPHYQGLSIRPVKRQ